MSSRIVRNVFRTAGTVAVALLAVPSAAVELPVDPVCWLDASQASTVLTNSNGVYQLTSLAGTAGASAVNNNNDTTEPSYVISGSGTINGLPVIHFTSLTSTAGGSQWLTSSISTGTPATIMYVGRLSGSTNQRMLSGLNNNWLLGYHSGYMDRAYFGGWVSSNSTTADINTHMYEAVITGAGLNSTVYGYSGTALYQIASNQNGVATPQGLRLGGGYNGYEYSTGDIGEVLVFNTALSVDQRAAVESYLETKWFVSVPEPSTFALLGVGAVGLVGYAWRAGRARIIQSWCRK
jgi:hypothetical protein